MLKTGMIIGERYEIVGKVGSGGMADVYKAKDHKLNRFVAVKVLKQEFREDTTFIKKFKTEAQSAAGLTHPNIVNVFDVGEDEGVHYIVMELVEGITLKEYISKKGKLSIKEATSIAIQVSMGLEAAHSHNIIHRDVKPQNIIISTDGKVKVTDFGIARAASSNTISSNVMGSVHYSSPEQVRGGYSNEKSDIYSLGITLYEMVTGKVPFEGDTTVAIAIKHLQEEMVAPSTYSPDLPYSLEQIIFKCTQKSVDRRYDNMEEVIADLKHSLIDPQGDFVVLAPLTNHAQTVIISGDDLNKIKQTGIRDTANVPSRTYDDDIDDDEDDDDDDDDGEISSKLEKVMTIGGLIIGAVIIIILIAFIGRAAGIFRFPFGSDRNDAQVEDSSSSEDTSAAEENSDQVEVPNLVGMTEDEATAAVTDKGLGLQFTQEVVSDEYAKGTICSQEIEPGTMVDKYTTIKYELSSGSAELTVPDVVGEEQGAAEKTLTDMGFVVTTTKEYSYDYDIGEVMAMSPEAGNIGKAGDTITLTISMGDEYSSVTVPDVIGMTEADAKTALAALNVTVESQNSDSVAAGTVMNQSVAEGNDVEKGSAITITVSTGPATPVDTSGTWKCTQTLDTPLDYNGGAIQMELVQTVNGTPTATIVLDGQQIEFPYTLDLVGAAGVEDGTLYVKELVNGDYVELGHYPITFKKES